MEHFLLRDLKEVLHVRKGKHHSVLFIPDSFLFKELTETVSCICNIPENNVLER